MGIFLGGACNFFHSEIILKYLRMRSAFSWWYPCICSKSRLGSFSALAIISRKELEVQLTADEDLLGSRPHQFKATNAQHKCILKEGTHCIGAVFIMELWHQQYTLSTWKMTDVVNEICLRLEEKTGWLLFFFFFLILTV